MQRETLRLLMALQFAVQKVLQRSGWLVALDMLPDPRFMDGLVIWSWADGANIGPAFAQAAARLLVRGVGRGVAGMSSRGPRPSYLLRDL